MTRPVIIGNAIMGRAGRFVIWPSKPKVQDASIYTHGESETRVDLYTSSQDCGTGILEDMRQNYGGEGGVRENKHQMDPEVM
jgi:hypothetical protein